MPRHCVGCLCSRLRGESDKTNLCCGICVVSDVLFPRLSCPWRCREADMPIAHQESMALFSCTYISAATTIHLQQHPISPLNSGRTSHLPRSLLKSAWPRKTDNKRSGLHPVSSWYLLPPADSQAKPLVDISEQLQQQC
jgi:hypothetical protein